MALKILLLIYVVTLTPVYTQDKNQDLVKDSYATIYKKIKASKGDSIYQKCLLDAYLRKAKAEGNWDKIVKGYKNHLHAGPIAQQSIYADSMIYTAKRSKSNILLTKAHVTKGVVHYGQKEYVKALDSYVIANDYLAQSATQDLYLKYKIKYMIGLMNYFLEEYQHALAGLEECLSYFKKQQNKTPYLNTLHAIGLCYRSMKNQGICSEINQQGIEQARKAQNTRMESYFSHSEGINQYFLGNYQASIDTLIGTIPIIKEYNKVDFANVILGQYYLGKNYWALGKSKEAINYFKLVDQSFTTKNYTNPVFLGGYDIMIKYYKSIGDLKSYQYYLERKLLATTEIMNKKAKIFSKIHHGYDLANQNRKRDTIRDNRGIKKEYLVLITIVFTLLLSVALLYSKNENQKKRHQELLRELTGKRASSGVRKNLPRTNEIKSAKLNAIIAQLTEFEQQKKYLDSHITISGLATSFKTNTKYLSKVIHQEKGKKFVDYINDLKTTYLIESLKGDLIDLSATTKDLILIAGFSSPDILRRYFKNHTGMTPTAFIKKLKRKKQK